jgi:membrane protease YdiL (CAAX protease family)
MAHTQLGLIIPFAAIGFILAFLYQRTGSIFVSMSLHFLFNLISFTLLVVSARDDQVNGALSVLHRVVS